MKTSLTFAVLGFGLAVALAVGSAPAAAQTKITVGYTAVSEFLPLFVAKERGLFAKRGLVVTPQQLAYSSVMPAALQSGSVQIAGAASPVLLLANDNGMKLVGVAGTSVHQRESKAIGLVVKTNGPIKTPADFVGKKVGVPGLNAALHILTRKWLDDRGVDMKRVTFVEAPFPQMGDLLRGGSIDAAITADPFLGRIVQSGVGALLFQVAADLPAGFSNMLYMTTDTWEAKNGEVVKHFRQALHEAIVFAQAHPEEARADMGKYIKLPPQVLASLAVPSFDASLKASQLTFWADTMSQQQMLRAAPKLDTLVAK
jgi:NitT/TauT family transport system substrate-binding protein